jgi:4-hydroxy-2-oxoheptanedioate aldolase
MYVLGLLRTSTILIPIAPFPQASFTGVETAADYLKQANDSLLTIVQIETALALQNVAEIAAVPGIDILFVGPFDLGINIGQPITTGSPNEELQKAILKVHEAAKQAGKKSGMFCTSGAQAREYADEGFDMINIATDVGGIQAYFAEQVKAAKGSYAHSALNMAKGAVGKVSGPYGK